TTAGKRPGFGHADTTQPDSIQGVCHPGGSVAPAGYSMIALFGSTSPPVGCTGPACGTSCASCCETASIPIVAHSIQVECLLRCKSRATRGRCHARSGSPACGSERQQVT